MRAEEYAIRHCGYVDLGIDLLICDGEIIEARLYEVVSGVSVLTWSGDYGRRAAFWRQAAANIRTRVSLIDASMSGCG